MTILARTARHGQIFRLREQQHQSQQAIGLTFGIASAGAVLGALTAQSLRRAWGFGRSFLGSLVLQGASIFLIGVVDQPHMIAASATTFSLGLMLRNINSMSFRQEVTPSHLLGRVTAALWSILLTLEPIGAVVGTSLAAVTSAQSVLMGMGVLGTGVALLGLATPVRKPSSRAPCSWRCGRPPEPRPAYTKPRVLEPSMLIPWT